MTIENPRDSTLRKIRETAKLKQRELANIIGMDWSNISRWERVVRFDELRLYQIRQFVEGCGGKVKLVIEIDDQEIIK